MHNIDLRKAREREVATLDENIDEQWNMLTPVSVIKIEGKNRGGEEGRHL